MSKFTESAYRRFGPKRADSRLTVEKIDHHNGSALCLLTFVTKKGVVKTAARKVFLNPETYPDAIRLEGKTVSL